MKAKEMLECGSFLGEWQNKTTEGQKTKTNK